MAAQPLSGLKVIELASVLAGPAVGMFFAELGAEVIKVENRSAGGDMTRHWKLGMEDKEAPISAYFSAVNYGKSYRDIDISSPEGKAELMALLEDCDVFISNLKAGSAKRFGLSPAELRKAFPKLIIANIKGFESDDTRVAFDAVLQAETGYISMNGQPEALAKLPVAFIDLFAAHQIKEGVLLALLQRASSGAGAVVDVSLEAAALSSLANQASNYLMAGKVAQPMGTLHPNIAPYGEVLKSMDGKSYILAVGTQRQFESLSELLELGHDARFANNQERVKHRAVLLEVMQMQAGLLDGEEFYQACLSRQVPIGHIKSLDQVLQSDCAQDLNRREEIEGLSTERLSSVAFKLS